VKKEAIANSKKRSVTFELPGVEAQTMAVVGDFNDWEPANGAMKRRKDGVWTKAVRLEPGRYMFRYVADGNRWHNDPQADGYEASGMGEDNSVLLVD
jgi:1,4-alpha-glucan branching enzyme